MPEMGRAKLKIKARQKSCLEKFRSMNTGANLLPFAFH
jgi:hypothetical protein